MTGLVFQAQPVFFDLEKFFVKRENFSGTSCTCGGKLILRVCQNLLEMTGCHDLDCRFWTAALQTATCADKSRTVKSAYSLIA
jgi:hypothetical protein